jgi:hypothetical protein
VRHQDLVAHLAVVDVANDQLIPLAGNNVTDDPRVAAALAAAPALGREGQLASLIGNGEETGRTGKDFKAKVGPEPKGVHVNPVLVDQRYESVNLVGQGEVDLINNDDTDSLSHH